MRGKEKKIKNKKGHPEMKQRERKNKKRKGKKMGRALSNIIIYLINWSGYDERESNRI
jgi:hypothetical protein